MRVAAFVSSFVFTVAVAIAPMLVQAAGTPADGKSIGPDNRSAGRTFTHEGQGERALQADTSSTPQSASNHAGHQPEDDWRFVFFGGRWWYWTPKNSWLLWDNGAWRIFGAVASRPMPYAVGYSSGAAPSGGEAPCDCPPTNGNAAYSGPVGGSAYSGYPGTGQGYGSTANYGGGAASIGAGAHGWRW